MPENERTRVLEMLKNGLISVDEAEELLSAMDSRETVNTELVAMKDSRGRKPKKLRITVDANENEDGSGKAKVNVNIPMSLIKSLGPVALSSIPKDAKIELNKQGIDISEIIKQVIELAENGLDEDIVNIDAGENGSAAKVRIYVE